MKRIIATVGTLFMLMTYLSAQSIEGTWVTRDDKTGVDRSHVTIYMENGQLQGKITKLLESDAAEICTACKGELKGKPIVGLNILSKMKGKGKKYSGGILDPETGKQYKCKLTLVNDDKIKLRGYIGTPMLGRTQYWYRLAN